MLEGGCQLDGAGPFLLPGFLPNYLGGRNISIGVLGQITKKQLHTALLLSASEFLRS